MMALLTSIPIDCWICGAQYRVPATISQRPSAHPQVYSQPISAHFWVNMDQTPIQMHVQGHWPVLVLWFFMWRAFIDISGIDPLEYYR